MRCRAKLLQEIANYREAQRTKELALLCRTLRKTDLIAMIMQAVIKEHPYVYVSLVKALNLSCLNSRELEVLINDPLWRVRLSTPPYRSWQKFTSL